MNWTQTVSNLFIYRPVNSTAQALWNAPLGKKIDPSLLDLAVRKPSLTGLGRGKNENKHTKR